MTKENFVKTINFIKEKKEQEEALVKIFETICKGYYTDTFIFSEYETKLIEMLHEALHLPADNDDIAYFIYELDFGKNYEPGLIEENGKEIDFSTAEKLYDYLITIKK